MGEPAAASEAVARIQQRWGAGVIRRGRIVGDPQLRGVLVRGSGFAGLDALLGARGIPDGLTLLRGPMGSGRTTLALRTLAATQGVGGAAAWIDASHTFDGLEAASRGVLISSLPIIAPRGVDEALEMAGSILSADAADLIVLDCAGVRGKVRVDALERLAARARRAGSSIVAMLDGESAALSDLALGCRTVDWLRVGADVVGRRMEVQLQAGPRRGASVLIDLFEGRGAREAIRNGRIAPA